VVFFSKPKGVGDYKSSGNTVPNNFLNINSNTDLSPTPAYSKQSLHLLSIQ